MMVYVWVSALDILFFAAEVGILWSGFTLGAKSKIGTVTTG